MSERFFPPGVNRTLHEWGGQRVSETIAMLATAKTEAAPHMGPDSTVMVPIILPDGTTQHAISQAVWLARVNRFSTHGRVVESEDTAYYLPGRQPGDVCYAVRRVARSGDGLTAHTVVGDEKQLILGHGIDYRLTLAMYEKLNELSRSAELPADGPVQVVPSEEPTILQWRPRQPQ